MAPTVAVDGDTGDSFLESIKGTISNDSRGTTKHTRYPLVEKDQSYKIALDGWLPTVAVDGVTADFRSRSRGQDYYLPYYSKVTGKTTSKSVIHL